MKQPLPILLNTKAGALRILPGFRRIEEMAATLGLAVEILPFLTTAALRQKTRELVQQGVPRIVVAGGDGTIEAAVQELVHSKTALGILPQGTRNNFATALRLPQDLPSALRILKYGHVEKVSVGKIGDRYFTESAGIGIFADILALYGSGTNKNLFRAVYALARTLFNLRSNRVNIQIDGHKRREHVSMCTVHNCYRMASALPMAPDAKLTDNYLDVVLIGELSLRELLRYYRAARAQLHMGLPKVTSLKAKEVRISCKHRLNVHCDDIIIGTTPVNISIEPRSLRVVVDAL